jgi:hypothetical protein
MTYYQALEACVERYEAMSHQDPDLLEFLSEFRIGIQNKLPLMKLNRWLGYIQGVLIERKRTTVQAEREWTRPLFKPLDFPETIVLDKD